MANEVRVVTSQSWISRIFGSIGGVFIGMALVLASIVLLFWNEGRYVETYRTLVEGQGLVIDVPATEVSDVNEGKLVHVIGEVDVGDGVTDEDFGISAPALRLQRTVSIYQWQEREESHAEKKLGGGEETVTTYTYEKVWSETLNPSSGFRERAGHENPSEVAYESVTLDVSEARVGAFTLQGSQIAALDTFAPLLIREVPEDAEWPDGAQLVQGSIYIGHNSRNPNVGDLKVSYQIVSANTLSVVSGQSGQSFAPFETRAGGTIDMAMTGKHTATEMFASAQNDNVVLTWVLRLVGLVLSVIAFSMILRPLSVLADVIPLIGNIVEGATGFMSFLMGLAVSAVTIAIAWVFFRPLIGIALLVVAAAAVYGITKLRTPAAKAA